MVLPKALYGCERTQNQLNMLGKAHRFCLKYIQSLPKHTRTVIALSCIELFSTETETDKQKMIFVFGQFCNLPPDLRMKEVFVHRLMHNINSPGYVIGFLPGLHRILSKYELEYHLYADIHCKFWELPLQAVLERISKSWYYAR